jgi:HORMA domain
MYFTYNDSCPPEYQPPGMKALRDRSFIIRKRNNRRAWVGEVAIGENQFVHNSPWEKRT